MTRRIIVAILASVWAMMLIGGFTAYFVTRSILVKELDARLLARAAALPEVAGRSGVLPYSSDRYLIRTEHGQVLRQFESMTPAVLPRVISANFVRLGDGGTYRSITVEFDPVHASATTAPSAPVTVVYSGSAEAFSQMMRRLAISLGAVGLVGGAIAAAVAAAASRTALRPLREVADVVGDIDEHNLSRRVETERLPEELRMMGDRLNGMLARIDRYFQQRRRFLADASHELRTPVAALVNMLEVNLAGRQSDPARTRRTLENCLTDAKVLRELVTRLTTQVRSELNANQDAWQEIDLVRLLQECLAVAEGLALAKEVRVAGVLPDACFVRTQPDRLRRICLNLLANGVSYNVPGGLLELRCEPQGGDVLIAVRDTGVGISAEHLPHVFTPFFRADPSREQSEGHLGLGMYQVQTDITALGSSVQVESGENAGTTVRFILQNAGISNSERVVVHEKSEMLPK
ncbi:MAG: HAMP domain-containing sensor histidine kinase [Tepidisphaeraceae bacterium]